MSHLNLHRPDLDQVRLQSSPPTTGLHASDLALLAMTDFRSTRPFVVEPARHIDVALHDMILAGVRALLVTDRDDSVLGLITANDIMGEKPFQFLQNPQCDSFPCRRADIRVEHVMTSLDELPLVSHEELSACTVSDILENLEREGVSHLLVVERTTDRHKAVRGIFSRTQIERELLAAKGRPAA
ncbi:MAG: CBS domain-containing protein [Proteobacteria bacterium]|nr:CBS domain-containing protein [Pseudomonadota bacterium]